MSLMREPYTNIRKTQNRSNKIDTHELLKAEIAKQGDETNYVFALPSGPVTNPTINVAQSITPAVTGQVGVNDIHIQFESEVMSGMSGLQTGQMSFSIPILNNNLPIDNCTHIRIGKFYFPLIRNDANSPEYYFFRRIYMQITSITSNQVVRMANSNDYHFEFDIENLNSVSVLLNPVNDIFYFRQPITSMSTFDVRFFAPNGIGGYRNISLPKHRVTVRSVPNSTPFARFEIIGDDITNLIDSALIPNTYPSPVIPLTPNPPIAVYMRGFNSSNANINNQVNSSQGLFVTGFVLNFNTFQIASLDFNGFNEAVTCTMYIAKNRISFPIRFSTINTNNNYLLPNHI